MDARDAAARDGGERGDAEPFLAVRGSVARVRLWAGFAAFVAWINLLFCFEGLLRDQVAYGGGVIHDPLFLAATLAAALLLLASPRIGRSAVRRRAARRGVAESGDSGEAVGPARLSPRRLALWSVAGAVAGVAGVVLSAAVVQDAMPFRVAAMAAGLVAGAFIARFTLWWGAVVSAFDMREVLASLCLAFCVQWLPFIVVVFAGTLDKTVLAAALPLCSGWCLRGFEAAGDLPRKTQDSPLGRADAGKPSATGRIAGALFCFSFVIQFVWTFNVAMTSEPLDEGLFWAVFALVFGASFGIMGLVLALMNRWRMYRMELFYRSAFLFGIAGSCALGVAHEQLFFSYTVVYVAYALIVPTMWVLSWSVVFMQKEDPARVFGRIFGLQYLAFFCAFVVVKLVQASVGAAEAAGLLPYFCLGSALVLTVAYVAVLPERTLFLLSPRLFELSHASLDERCRDIAAHYALTARETEIFALLARGRDVGYIEKELFISRNTVNTHRKNLYRKLGIHTQQELLSLIEETLA